MVRYMYHVLWWSSAHINEYQWYRTAHILANTARQFMGHWVWIMMRRSSPPAGTRAGDDNSSLPVNIAAGLVTHTTTFRELTLRELRFVRVPAPHGSSVPAGVASLRPAHGCHFATTLQLAYTFQ